MRDGLNGSPVKSRRAPAKTRRSSSVMGSLFVGVLVLAAVWGITLFRESTVARYDAAEKQVASEISRQLNVEVLRMNGRVGIDIKDAEGKTFNCDYPNNFAGHLYGCEETNVID